MLIMKMGVQLVQPEGRCVLCLRRNKADNKTVKRLKNKENDMGMCDMFV